MSVEIKSFARDKINLGVQARIDLIYEEHLLNQEFKLRLALAKNAKLAFFGLT